MTLIASFDVKVHKTTDKKKLKEGKKIYEYGVVNIRSPLLFKAVGKLVKVKIESESK